MLGVRMLNIPDVPDDPEEPDEDDAEDGKQGASENPNGLNDFGESTKVGCSADLKCGPPAQA